MNPSPDRLAQVDALLAKADFAGALLAAQRLFQKFPSSPAVALQLSNVHARMGKGEQAVYFAQRAATLAPGEPEVLVVLSRACEANRDLPGAEAALRAAVAMRPGDDALRASLASVLMMSYRATEALEACGGGVHPGLSMARSAALMALCRIGEASRESRDAAARWPHDLQTVQALPTVLNYDPDADPAEMAAAHRAFGALCAANRPGLVRLPERDRNPERRLRVGFLSNDLRAHSCANFLAPLLRNLDRAAFETVAYSTTVQPDAQTAALRPCFAAWRDCGSLDQVQLTELIVRDGVDVLIDLMGHTINNSVFCMSMRPAPVQATWLGYPNTTGLDCVDWRIVDGVTDPAGDGHTPTFDSRCTERLLRLDPCFLCYDPPKDAPPARRADGPPAFGSFNASTKINDRVLDAWAKVLLAAPGWRLLLKAGGFRDAGVRAAVMGGLERRGVEASRIEVLPHASTTREHLEMYSRVDIALDTFPYNGATTTCEALWMGVPVVTFAGRTHAGRVGASLVKAVGLGELCGEDEEGFIRIAAALAADSGRLAGVRAGLRERVGASVLCDGAGFGSRFGAGLREMWRA